MKLANRLEDFEAYLGTAMNIILTRMREEGKDVINLGLGDPDVVPPETMRKSLADACYDPESHHYPSFYSPMPLKEAIARDLAAYRDLIQRDAIDLTQLGPADGDGDGVDNKTDCTLADPGAFAVPGEVAELAVDRGPGRSSELSWASLAPDAGAGTVHDVARGDLAGLPATGSCAGAAGIACGLAATTLSD